MASVTVRALPSDGWPHGVPAADGAIARSAAAAQVRGICLAEFQPVRRLGGGASGAVYLAQRRAGGPPVALKVLCPQLSARRDYVACFHREAGVMARLCHPGIVAVHGAGSDAGLHFLAMEYIDGTDAGALLARCGGRLRVADAARIAAACARTLAYAHARGFVHRDIKPANILVGHDRRIVLTDFGLARPWGAFPLADGGLGVGTPEYMPPEQVRVDAPADPRADVYALGVVLYRLATGVLPFPGRVTAEVLTAKCRGVFPPASRRCPGVPRQLDLVLARMLARDPEDRYPDCEQVAEDLEPLAGPWLSCLPRPRDPAPPGARAKC